MPRLVIGTIVRYFPSEYQASERFADPLPAIITGIGDWMKSTMDMTVFCRFGPPIPLLAVPFSEDGQPGTWKFAPDAE